MDRRETSPAFLTTIKVYKAKTQEKAAKKFSADAPEMAGEGWQVVSQSWSPGRGGCLRTLCLGIIGAWIFPPNGTLLVTYRRDA